MPEGNTKQLRSQKIFKQASPEVQELVRKIMNKERQEQHKNVRDQIYKTLLQYVKESTP